MERYGRVSEGSQSDPSQDWIGQGGETGLEESVWQLGLGGGESYPERPEEADCNYYIRTGFCGYGSRCRFNHPRDRGMVMGAAGTVEYPERVGEPVCQYFMRTGTCKYGASCKYHHPRQGIDSLSPVPLNYLGYPLRPGEKECSYFVKTGQCKFGATCKFHHPIPSSAGVQVPAPSPAAQAPLPTSAIYPAMQSPSVASSQQYGVVVARSHLLPGSYLQGPYGPMLLSPGMVPFPGWNPYAASVSPVPSPGTQPAIGSGSLYGMAPLSPSAPAYTGSYHPVVPTFAGGASSSSEKEHSFPDRPDQPECQFYMKTGDCKFGASCRYHHPPELVAPKTNVVLSPMGLPLRPGAQPCTHYTQRGACKFGSTCKFDHPVGPLSYSRSASSLADMPVAPYPVGSSAGTTTTTTSQDSFPTRISSTSSRPVGSAFSTTGFVQPVSSQSSAPSSGDVDNSSNTEAQTSS